MSCARCPRDSNLNNVEVVEMVDDVVVGMKEMSLLTKAQHLTIL